MRKLWVTGEIVVKGFSSWGYVLGDVLWYTFVAAFLIAIGFYIALHSLMR